MQVSGVKTVLWRLGLRQVRVNSAEVIVQPAGLRAIDQIGDHKEGVGML